MEFTAQEIAQLLGGTVKGNPNDKISSVSKIQEGKPGTIAFLANPKYEEFIYSTRATAVLVNEDFKPTKPLKTSLIYVKDAYVAFSSLLEEYQRIVSLQKVGIEEPSFRDGSAEIGESPYIGAFAYLGKNVKVGNNCKIYPHVYLGDNVTVGDNTILYAGVKVYADCTIGSYCTIHSGAVVGSDGFGFAPQADGTYKTIPQIGNVIIEDHVDIGANTVIDCATMGSTHIKKGVKLDNLVQIAHNVTIGENTVVAAQTGISGSATLGKNNVLAGQVGIVGHIVLPDRTTIGAQSGIMNPPKEEGKILLGSPALEHKNQLRSLAIFRRLPDIKKRIEKLEAKLLNSEDQ